PKRVRSSAGGAELVDGRVPGEADRKSRGRCVERVAHEFRDDGRVHTAREQCSKGDVRHQLPPDCMGKPRAQGLLPAGTGLWLFYALKAGPKCRKRRLLLQFIDTYVTEVTRRDFPGVPVKRPRRRHKTVDQVLVERLCAKVSREQTTPARGGQLARKPPRAV